MGEAQAYQPKPHFPAQPSTGQPSNRQRCCEPVWCLFAACFAAHFAVPLGVGYPASGGALCGVVSRAVRAVTDLGVDASRCRTRVCGASGRNWPPGGPQNSPAPLYCTSPISHFFGICLGVEMVQCCNGVRLYECGVEWEYWEEASRVVVWVLLMGRPLGLLPFRCRLPEGAGK